MSIENGSLERGNGFRSVRDQLAANSFRFVPGLIVPRKYVLLNRVLYRVGVDAERSYSMHARMHT